jgi:DNA-directed RNA polymerase subunit RPC12/RpoP
MAYKNDPQTCPHDGGFDAPGGIGLTGYRCQLCGRVTAERPEPPCPHTTIEPIAVMGQDDPVEYVCLDCGDAVSPPE